MRYRVSLALWFKPSRVGDRNNGTWTSWLFLRITICVSPPVLKSWYFYFPIARSVCGKHYELTKRLDPDLFNFVPELTISNINHSRYIWTKHPVFQVIVKCFWINSRMNKCIWSSYLISFHLYMKYRMIVHLCLEWYICLTFAYACKTEGKNGISRLISETA